MESDFEQALTDSVREASRATSPDDLKARGVTRLRSLNLAEMARLVEQAVNRTLLARTIGEKQDDVAGTARGEFMRLMSDKPQAGDSLESKAQIELRRLKAELSQQIKKQTVLLTDDAVRQREEQLEAKLREVFARWQGEDRIAAPLEDDVINVALGELHAELSSLQAVKIDKSANEISVLERRINKLCQHLGQTEEQLARVLERQRKDSGRASYYRQVQGLNDGEEEHAKKKMMITQIFDANVKMQGDHPA